MSKSPPATLRVPVSASKIFMPIRFVYFDLGNVLIAFDRERTNAAVGRLFNVEPAVADAAVHGSGRLDAMESGELTGERFADQIRDELGGHGIDTQTLLDAVCDMFTPVAAMDGVVAEVRQCVGAVGILSNTCAAHWDWIGRMAYPVMDTSFDVTVTSYQVGCMKPGEAIYQAAEDAALEYNHAAAGELLFLDDRPENVEAAVARGWNAECCLGGPDAIAALRRHAVLP